MTQTRVYTYKDSDMLMASKVIATSLTNQLPDLSMVRSNWTPEYAQQLHTKIDDAMENYLGLNKRKHSTMQLLPLLQYKYQHCAIYSS